MSIPALVAGAPLRVGSTNREAVKAVQAALRMPETGDYDRFVVDEVMDFQKAQRVRDIA